MATRYAVASGNWSNTTSVWSDTESGTPGNFVPTDGDNFIIQAGVSVLMDTDMSAGTGLTGSSVIRGSSSGDPGMLYFKNGTNGYLRFASDSTLMGDSGSNTAYGRILINSDGNWNTTTPLSFDYKATIRLGSGLSYINLLYIDLRSYPDEPSHKYVTVCSNKYAFNAATGVDPVTNRIDLGVTPPAENTLVIVKPADGASLPEGIIQEKIYYVVNISGTTVQLSHGWGAAPIVDITSIGSGSCYLLTGHSDTGTQTLGIFEDLSTDLQWRSIAGYGIAALINRNIPGSLDKQVGAISAVDTTGPDYSITINFNGGSNVDSVQDPGSRIYLLSRNIQFISENSFMNESYACMLYAHSGVKLGGLVAYHLFSQGGTGGTGLSKILGGSDLTNLIMASFMDGIYITSQHTVPQIFNGTYIINNTGLQRAGLFSGATTITGDFVGCYNALQQPGYATVINSTFFANFFAFASGIEDHLTVESALIIGCLYGLYNSYGTSRFGAASTFIGCKYPFIMSLGTLYASCTIHGDINCDQPAFYQLKGFFLFAGKIYNMNNGIFECIYPFVASGVIDNCYYGITGSYTGGSATFSDLVIRNCNTGINIENFRAYNLTLENNNADVYVVPGAIKPQGIAFNCQGISGNLRAWSSGGTLTTVQEHVPPGYADSYKFTFTNGDFITLMEWELPRQANGKISIPVFVYNYVSSGSLLPYERISWALVDPSADPLITSTNQYLDIYESTGSNNDLLGSWEEHTLEYQKVDDRPILLRVWSYRGSEFSYAYCDFLKSYIKGSWIS